MSVDLEAGYGDRPRTVDENCRQVLACGAVGVNIEDGTGDPERPLTDLSLQLEKIAAARVAGQSRDVPLVVNARTDVFRDRIGPPVRSPERGDGGQGSRFHEHERERCARAGDVRRDRAA